MAVVSTESPCLIDARGPMAGYKGKATGSCSAVSGRERGARQAVGLPFAEIETMGWAIGVKRATFHSFRFGLRLRHIGTNSPLPRLLSDLSSPVMKRPLLVVL